MGRDQTANAARVVYRKVGVRLKQNSGTKKIAVAIREVMGNPLYQMNAKALSVKIREQGQWQMACEEQEQTWIKPQLHK